MSEPTGMKPNNRDPENSPVSEQLLDSLLRAALSPTESSEMNVRLRRGLDAIRSGAEPRSEQDHVQSKPRGPGSTGRRWLTWAVSACVVLGLFVLYQLNQGDRAAWAAIGKSISAASQDVARKYRVEIRLNPPLLSARTIECDLYVLGNDRFAFRHPALIPGTDFWLGQEGELSWVAPAVGPIRTGDKTALDRWLTGRDEIATPYLHVTSILERMSRGYSLKMLPEETLRTGLPQQDEMICQHVRGTLHPRLKSRGLPDSIELWAESAGGLAIRMILAWEKPTGTMGRDRIELQLLDVNDLPPDWFHHSAHAPGRRILQLDSREVMDLESK